MRAEVLWAALMLACASASPKAAQQQHFLQAEPASSDNINYHGCLPGYWGHLCSQRCESSNCVAFSRSDDRLGITCDKGTGEVTLCESCITGRWGDKCEKECATTEHCDLSRGSVTCNKGDGLGTRCGACKFGWGGAGCETEIMCQALDFSDPHMKADCSPYHAHKMNKTCTFRCDPGYEIVGALQLTCMKGEGDDAVGSWSNSAPVCAPKPCGAVVPIHVAPYDIVRTGEYHSPRPARPGFACVGMWKCTGEEGLDFSKLVAVDDITPQCFEMGSCSNCDSRASCVTVGDQEACVCNEGFWGSGYTCNACQKCDAGYKSVHPCGRDDSNLAEFSDLFSHDTVCEDVDECERKCEGPYDSDCHTCDHRCHNKPGFYTCSCDDGYRLSADLKTCIPTVCQLHNVAHARKSCSGVAGTECDFTESGSCKAGFTGYGKLKCNLNGEWVGDAVCSPMECNIRNIPHINRRLPCEEHPHPWDDSLKAEAFSQCTVRCETGYAPSGSGVMTCEPCGDDKVSWSTDTRCTPKRCRAFVVDVALDVKCSGIFTDQPCLGGQHFQCPSGYAAKGAAYCGPEGVMYKDSENPARCEKDEDRENPCEANPCGSGVCIATGPGENRTVSSYVCRCKFPLVQSSDEKGCVLECPPPAAINDAQTECVYPPGFRRVLFAPGAPPSAVMVGSKDIPQAFRSTETRCEKIGYPHHYVWADRVPVNIFVSVEHPHGKVHGDKYKEIHTSVDKSGNAPMTYWLEGVTSSYFTFCYSDVQFRTTEPHAKIRVNFMAFSHAFGLKHGDAPFAYQTYQFSKSGSEIMEKYVGLSSFTEAPLVLTTLNYRTGDEAFCDALHCVCDEGVHNAASLMADDVYSDAIGLTLRENPRYRKRDLSELEGAAAQKVCGATRCGDCPSSFGVGSSSQNLTQSCMRLHQQAIANHDRTACSQGKDAVASWLALTPRDTAHMRTGTASIKYDRMNINEWLNGANCNFISFDTYLKEPVVFTSLNHRSGAATGSLSRTPSRVATWHVEGVDNSGFRLCYTLLLDRYDDQPGSQEDYINVDWVAFHV